MVAKTNTDIASGQGRANLPVSPFHSLNPHFGMLMGVDDFQLLQSYPRGKQWLHNAWLHGAGVVWGLGVAVDNDGRLTIGAGLAMDAGGRELYLPRDACLDLGEWLRANRGGPPLSEHLIEKPGGGLGFDAHVVIRFRACLERQVPALREPCEGDSAATAYSRVSENVELQLRPGLWQPPEETDGGQAFHRLRALFGLEPTDESETELIATMADIASLAEPDRPAARLAALGRLGALDSAELRPPGSEPGAPPGLFPNGNPADDSALGLPLANLTGVTFDNTNGEPSFSAIDEVDLSVRPLILPTRLLQELLCGPVCQCCPEPDAGGPRVFPDSVELAGSELHFRVDKPLSAQSVSPAAIQVLSYKNNHGWRQAPISAADYDSALQRITATLVEVPDGNLIRILVKGSGPTPLIGTDEIPLAGGVGGPVGGSADGRDFVHMFKRSG